MTLGATIATICCTKVFCHARHDGKHHNTICWGPFLLLFGIFKQTWTVFGSFVVSWIDNGKRPKKELQRRSLSDKHQKYTAHCFRYSPRGKSETTVFVFAWCLLHCTKEYLSCTVRVRGHQQFHFNGCPMKSFLASHYFVIFHITWIDNKCFQNLKEINHIKTPECSQWVNFQII